VGVVGIQEDQNGDESRQQAGGVNHASVRPYIKEQKVKYAALVTFEIRTFGILSWHGGGLEVAREEEKGGARITNA